MPAHFRNATIDSLTGFILILVSCMIPALSLGAETTATFSGTELPGYYVLNLSSSLSPFSEQNIASQGIFSRYVLYTTTYEREGKTWYRLRLGFFPSREVAENVRQTYLQQYAQAWIAKATEVEKAFSKTTWLFRNNPSTPEVSSVPDNQPATSPAAAPPITTSDKAAATVSATASAPLSTPLSTPLPESGPAGTAAQNDVAAKITPAEGATASLTSERLTELMELGRQAMANADYGRAVQIYTRVLEAPDTAHRQDAQEFLALARERKGQVAHAKAEYEKYLLLYPEGEGSDRVRQRLAALITAQEGPTQTTLRSAKVRSSGPQTWETFGSLSQYYRRDVSYLNDTDVSVNQSLLSTDLDYSARLRKSAYELRGRFSGGYDYDYLDNTDNEFRISSLYLDANYEQQHLSGRLGRQSQTSGGVLGRFDGLLAGYQYTPTLKLNLVAGLPVESGQLSEINRHKQFYGLSIDLGTYADAADFTLFYIAQQVDSISDRESVGGEVRYYTTDQYYFGMVDYDISYATLNAALLLGNWTFAGGTNLNAIIDHRKSPVLTTSNALQGQLAESIDELLDTYTEDEIRQLAGDRTPDSASYSFSVTHPLSENYQVGGDVTFTRFSATPASGGVEATAATGTDYYLSLQLMASSFFQENDLNILSLRYADTGTSNTTTITLNSRFPLSDQWRINPLLRLDYREFETDNSTQWTLAPGLRLLYRWRRNASFDFDLHTEWSNHQLAEETEAASGYYFSAGYRYDF